MVAIGNYFGTAPDCRSNESDDALVDSDTYLGIELELEGVNHLRYWQRFLTDNNWRWEIDHSLRGMSCELITGTDRGPIRGFDVMVALESLDMAIEAAKKKFHSTPDLSLRCSTHIHLECSGMDPDQITNLLLFWALVENTLLKAEAPERIDNNYCIPLTKAEDLKEHIANMISSKFSRRSVENAIAEWPKYSSINLQPLRSYGTIEFRIFPGAYSSENIVRWLNIVLSLRKAAATGRLKASHLPQAISGRGYDAVLDDLFPTDISERLKRYLEPRDMMDGARMVQSILTRATRVHPRSLPALGKTAEVSNTFKRFLDKESI